MQQGSNTPPPSGAQDTSSESAIRNALQSTQAIERLLSALVPGKWIYDSEDDTWLILSHGDILKVWRGGDWSSVKPGALS